jgi:hypothetical protein
MGWRFLVLTSLLLACTKQNPKSCRDGVCNDPSLPYCDVGGELSGTPFTCVAGDCTAGTFAACRGDTAITCNAAGTSFDDVQCELGCDAASGGCRLCNPNETACTNGTLATCDASGKVVASEKCALGCFEDQPRCRDIDPSNGLGQYLDMVVDPPDLDLSGQSFIDTSTGEAGVLGQPQVTVPNFLVSAPPGGASIRVFVVHDVTLGDVHVTGSNAATVGGPQPAVAIVASGEIVVNGDVTIGGPTDRPDAAAAGAVTFSSCTGGPPRVEPYSGGDALVGGGGGGHATPGGKGGDVAVLFLGPPGGGASGSPTLVPLRGGCPNADFVSGGGAIQLTSRKQVTVNGRIDVRGGLGDFDGQAFITGGGAGGGILIEAPHVVLGPSARLLATGGPGGAGSGLLTISDDAGPSIGAQCTPTSALCGSGGNGAAPAFEATAGMNCSLDTTKPRATSGGGGGGLGYERVNTADGTYTKANTTIEAAAVSSGPLQTR